MLPILSKILEKAVHTQLAEYLEKNDLLNKHQFGYRVNRSTKLASALFCDDVRRSIDEGKLVGAVYVDLTKAFDTIGHNVLLSKLPAYGITGPELTWFTDYLFRRHQLVSIGNTYSTSHPIFSGVPQGSMLGPLLFIIFFNDFGDVLSNSKFVMYADDTVIYCAHKDKSVIEKLLDEDLIRIGSYFDENELIINLKKGKTESMLFGTPQRLAKTDKMLKVSYRQQLINFVEEYKYLGNIVDKNLTFNNSFNKYYKKATSLIKLLAKTRKYLTVLASYNIYTSMIVPVLTYRSIVKLCMTRTQSNQILSVENRAKKIIGTDKLPKIDSMIK